MVCDIRNLAPRPSNRPQPQRRKEPPKKCPVQISEPLHRLIALMAQYGKLSMEQVIAKAVIEKAKAKVNTTADPEQQAQYFNLIKEAEGEIKQRYHGEKSRRSIQMYRLNAARRQKRATAPDTSVHSPRPNSIYSYGYPIEWRYGIPVPNPPRPR